MAEVAIRAELPREFIHYPYSLPVGGTTRTVNSGGNLQAALNATVGGDVIVLQAGAVFTGVFVLPKFTTNPTSWAYIISSALASLPAVGNRVGPGDAANMPKIRVATQVQAASAAIITDNGASYWRFSGIEIASDFDDAPNYIQQTFRVVNLAGRQGIVTQADYPHHFVFDRCYIHGAPDGNSQGGLAVNAAYVEVIDTYISEIHHRGIGDTQAIVGYDGTGPLEVNNCYLEGAGENTLFGGSASHFADGSGNPRDLHFTHCWYRKPRSWDPGDPSYVPPPLDSGHTTPRPWAVKNLCETKNGSRYLWEYCVFENCWTQGQTGEAITFKEAQGSGTGASWTKTSDITFRNNLVMGAEEVYQFVSRASPTFIAYTDKLTCEDNLAIDMRAGQILTKMAEVASFTDAQGVVHHDLPSNTLIHHNTLITTQASYLGGGTEVQFAGPLTTTAVNFDYQENISAYCKYGIKGGNSTDLVGLDSIGKRAPGSIITGNVHFDGGTPNNFAANKYPAGEILVANMAAIGFTDASDPQSRNVLNWALTGASAYHNASPDGTDKGCRNIATLKTHWDAAVAGVPAGAVINTAPVVQVAAALARVQGAGASVSTLAQVSDSQDNAGTLTVAVQGSLPTGITVNSLTNTNGTVTASVAASGAASTGPNTFTLRTTDSGALFTDVTITVNVTAANTAPTISAATAVTIRRSDPGAVFTVASVGDAEDAIGTLVVDATVVPAGLIVTGITNNAGSISATIQATNAAALGANTVTFRVTDSGALTATADFTVNVNPAPVAPTITAGSPISREQLVAPSTSTIATVSDPDQAAGTLIVTAPVVPAGITINNITNVAGTVSASVSASTAAAPGVYQATLRVTDNTGLFSETQFQITVTAATGTPTITAGSPITRRQGDAASSATICTVTDPGGTVGTVIVAAIVVPTGITISNINNAAGTVTADVAADGTAALGVNNVTLRATDAQGLTADAVFTVSVQTPNVGPSITAAAGVTRQKSAGNSVSPICTVSDVEDAAGSLTVTVVGALPTGITFDTITNTNGDVTARIGASSSATTGVKNITLRVTDSSDATNDTTFQINVISLIVSPTIVQTTSQVVVVAGAPGRTIQVGTVSDPQDPISSLTVFTSFVGSGLAVSGIAVDPTSGAITATIAATAGQGASNNKVVSFRAKDPSNNQGNVVNVSVPVVANQAPTITPAGAVTISPGADAVTVALATVSDDVDAPATLVGSIVSTPPGITVGDVSNVNGQLQASIFADPSVAEGPNVIQVRVVDSTALASQTPFTVNIPITSPYPSFTAAPAVSRTKGDAATSAILGSVSDPMDGPSSLLVTAQSLPSGVTIDNITVDDSGVVRGDVACTSDAAAGPNTCVLRVTNSHDHTADADFVVTALGNTAPTALPFLTAAVTKLGPALPWTLGSVSDVDTPGGQLTVSVQSTPTGVTIANLTNTNGNITADLSADGTASIGINLIGLRVTDPGGLFLDFNVPLRVIGANTAPPGGAVTTGLRRVKGSPPQRSVIASVTDVDDSYGALSGSVRSAPAGIVLTNIRNVNGVISADIEATSAAVAGANAVVLAIADLGGAETIFTLTVTIDAPAAPGLVNPRLTLTQLDPLPGQGVYRREGDSVSATYRTSPLTQADGDFFPLPFRAISVYAPAAPTVVFTIATNATGASRVVVSNGTPGTQYVIRASGEV